MKKPRMIILYGDSGSTKTSQSYHLARWINQTTGLKGRMLGSNASDSAPFEDSGMLEKGIVDFFDISNRKMALADMRRLAEGYWPRDVKDLPAGNKGYFKSDGQCLTTPEQWAKIGFYIIEGTTGIAALLLNHIRQQEEGVGFKHSFKYEEEGYVIGGLQEGHYGLVQQEMQKMIVQGFACLPVKYIIFTGLVGKGEDKRLGQTVYGPKAAGQATTFEIPSWFMDCLHLDTVIEDVPPSDQYPQGAKKESRVAWFQKHEDLETGLPYLCKVRIMPELYPALLKEFPKGYVKLGFKRGIDKLYEAMGKLVAADKTGTDEGKPPETTAAEQKG